MFHYNPILAIGLELYFPIGHSQLEAKTLSEFTHPSVHVFKSVFSHFLHF